MSSGLPQVVFLGSGSFGLPVLTALAEHGVVRLVVSQPDRPAGRGGALTPTPASVFALERGLPLARPEQCNEPAAAAQIRECGAEAMVVIAYGQKIGPELLRDRFAINLHGSLLPRWRGAAPYQRALMAGDPNAGVSVIGVAPRMDAGDIFATEALAIAPQMTAGELHDALSQLGPRCVLGVLREWKAGRARGVPQDEAQATQARKLSRADAWVDLSMPARLVRARINGLSPWPGCMLQVGEHAVKALRAQECAPSEGGAPAGAAHGTILADGSVQCAAGAVSLLQVQSAGGTAMSFDAWRRGRNIHAGARVSSAPPAHA